MDNRPAVQAHANVGDVPVAAVLGEEQQIADFKGWLNGFGSGVLHVCVTWDIYADPAMHKLDEARAIDPVTGRSTPQIGDTDQTRGIFYQRFALFLD